MSVTSLDPNQWQWTGFHEGVEWMVEVQLYDGYVHIESGPADFEARRHEAMGGRQSYESYLKEPAGWVLDFPDLAPWITKIVKMKVSKGKS